MKITITMRAEAQESGKSARLDRLRGCGRPGKYVDVDPCRRNFDAERGEQFIDGINDRWCGAGLPVDCKYDAELVLNTRRPCRFSTLS